MGSILKNLGKGMYHRAKKMFYRPYGIFDIGWVKEKILKHQKDNRLKHHLYKNRYKIVFRDSLSFLISVEELFINDFYKFHADNDRPKIIDCGSYIGTSILYFKIHYPGAVIHGFEPDTENYSLLKSNIENWDFPETHIQNAAIWIHNESTSFNSAGNMSSKIDTRKNSKADNLVQCVRLNDLLIEEIDFLKIDIEGAELEVLQDCEANLKYVKNLFVEYHGSYSENYKLIELLEILNQNNFKFYIKEGAPIYARPFWERSKEGDYDMLLNIFAFRN